MALATILSCLTACFIQFEALNKFFLPEEKKKVKSCTYPFAARGSGAHHLVSGLLNPLPKDTEQV